ncbi:MAG TPA: helix-turn-helix transcriptional regulator [Firmicutes bacterium]|nr:helix-turn-helix transcriptional regulator [Bacillota bacterium]
MVKLELPSSFLSNAERYAERFKALSDPTRLKILCLLGMNEELCVCKLNEALGGPQSGISYHLRILAEAGLVTRRDAGTWSYYRLNRKAIGELLSCECCSALTSTDIPASS